MQSYYLNNSGTRWIVRPAEKCILIHRAENYEKQRTIEFFESFGNFATANLKYKGKRISGFLEQIEGYDLPVLFVDYKEKF